MHFPSDKRITVFTGHYGSGKTEIAVNYTLQIESGVKEKAIVDLDFVNPYFRSREARGILEGHGVKVVASAEDCFDTDLPAFSREISGVLKNSDVKVIVDLGGDETGARAAGRFRNHIPDDGYEMFFVVNPFRPFTAKPEDISVVIKQVEAASRLRVTALVSNPNLLGETTLNDIITGHETVLNTSEYIGLPIQFLAVEASFGDLPELAKFNLPILKLHRLMTTPWE